MAWATFCTTSEASRVRSWRCQHFVEQPGQLQVFPHPNQRGLGGDAQLVKVFGKIRAEGAGPVDGPGIGSVGAAGIRHVRREHQQITRPDGVQLSGQLAPADALDAVDQQRLVEALRVGAKLAGGFGRIPRARSQQSAQ